MMQRTATLLSFFLLWNLPATSGAEVDFAAQVQPIFETHCYTCHGEQSQESNYRLDVRKRAMAGGDLGEPPIVPGDSAGSALLRRVSRVTEELAMPPEGEGESLTKTEVAILKKWIEAGAPWPDELAGDHRAKLTTDHWSFQPINRVSPPQTHSTWPRNAIDCFILDRLRANQLQPSPPAEPVTLVRRVFLDMHGLPPSPSQVLNFTKEPTQAAYEKVVNEVLNSIHYGERWARHWLDVVRFGESTGYEVNRDRENAYHYRDYVIDALNADKSYRDFVIEQLAGDVVGSDVGTGFLVGGPYDMVKSPDKNLTLMQRQDELADYVNTTATAFLGLTVGCARCHNHKFDPILQQDYYSMQAVFAGVQHGERELPGPDAQRLQQEISSLEQQISEAESQVQRFRESAPPPVNVGSVDPVRFDLNVESFEPTAAKFVRFTIKATTGAQPCLDELEVFDEDTNVALASSGTIATASGTLPGYKIHQLEHIHDGKYGNSHSWISNTIGGGWVALEFPRVHQIHRIQWGRDRTGVVKDRLATSYLVEVATEPGNWRTVASSENRLPRNDAAPAEDDFLDRLPPKEADVARQHLARLAELRKQLSQLRESIPKAYIGTFKTPEVIHRLYRGDPLAPREVVVPDALSVLSSLQLSNETPEAERRLALAEWIADPGNPLTARVIVNRVWHYHFGTGLVSTPSDFGNNGTRPSHPELLDWLAWNFMQNEWSLKWLHREILLSNTYRQSSSPRADGMQRDADCRLLWRFPPRRLEAEAIRDCVLSVSGFLNKQAGGPGFLLFEIDHENVHHYFPKKEFGPAEFRRMIYMTKIRQEQDDVFGIFDCPDGGQVIPSRSQSTTPLQALSLLNSQFMLRQAEFLAERIRPAGDHSEQVRALFKIVFSRPPADAELESCIPVVREHGLEALTRAVLNSNEFLFLQ